MSTVNPTANSHDDNTAAANGAVNHHPAFKWIRSERIDSLNVTLQEYQHIKTGAHSKNLFVHYVSI